jgi:hypothetical protein
MLAPTDESVGHSAADTVATLTATSQHRRVQQSARRSLCMSPDTGPVTPSAQPAAISGQRRLVEYGGLSYPRLVCPVIFGVG